MANTVQTIAVGPSTRRQLEAALNSSAQVAALLRAFLEGRIEPLPEDITWQLRLEGVTLVPGHVNPQTGEFVEVVPESATKGDA